MSFKTSTNARNNKTNTKSQQPFCKVCFDAKRDDYNTHFLKDFSGPQPIVLCPYLLALKCNYCKEQGHTVSYCEILKAKKENEIVPSRQQQPSKAPSQNGNFFIMRVSAADKKQTVTHSSRETVSEKKKSISIVNHFALLEDNDDEVSDEWEMPKYNKARNSDIVAIPRKEVAVAIAVAEPEPVEEVVNMPSGPTWAKIVATPAPKKTAPVLSVNEVLKKDVSSLFVTSSQTTPAAYEKPMPKFVLTDTKAEKIEKYFYMPPPRSWADDSSEDDGW